jgi:tRNA G18 (ribose-2'-O)-methylase SpoU
MARPQPRPARPPQGDRSRTTPAKLLRVAGLPAVTALFAKAPHRVERLFFDQRMRAQVGAFCAELARTHKPYRLVPSEEVERVAGSVMHGGIVALAHPQPVPVLDLDKAADWRVVASRCCCSMASGIHTISARSSEPPLFSGSRASYCRIIRRRPDHPTPAIAWPRAAWNM